MIPNCFLQPIRLFTRPSILYNVQPNTCVTKGHWQFPDLSSITFYLYWCLLFNRYKLTIWFSKQAGQTARHMRVSVKQRGNNHLKPFTRNCSCMKSLFCNNTLRKTQLQTIQSFLTKLYCRVVKPNQEWAMVLWWLLKAFGRFHPIPLAAQHQAETKVFPAVEPNESWTWTLHSWSC